MELGFPLSALLVVATTVGAAAISIRIFPELAFSSILFYTFLTINLSVAYLDHNRILISETNLTSFNTGATFRCLAYNLSILAGMAFGCAALRGVKLTPKRPQLVAQLNWIVMFSTYAALALFIVNAILTGKQAIWSETVSRHNYWVEFAKIPMLADVFGKLFIAFPMVVTVHFLFSTSRRRWTWFCGGICAYLLILAISGAKFHAFIVPLSLIVGCFASFRLYHGERLVTKSETVATLAIFALLLMYGTLNVMTRGIARDSTGPLEALTIRFLHLQGGSYWSCDLLSDVHTLGPELFVSDMTRLVDEIVTPGLVNDFNGLKVNLAVGLPSTAVLAIGKDLAAIPCFIFGFFFAYVNFVLKVGTIHNNLGIAALGAYQWLWAGSVYSRGNLDQITDVKSCVVAVAILLLGALTIKGEAS